MPIPFLGEIFAIISAFFYAFSSVAIIRNLEGGGTENGAYLSVVMTAALSGGLWLIIGNDLPVGSKAVWIGVGFFVVAGLLANLFGRMLMFRSIELLGVIETGILRRLIPVFAFALAVIVLGERITTSVGIGFVLVFSAVAVVVFNSRTPAAMADAAPQLTARDPRNLRTGRIIGVASTASYGGAYVSRKIALQDLPDPLLGTFIGAVTGLVLGQINNRFKRRKRIAPQSGLRRPRPWQLIAAVTVSLGQMAQFFALNYTTVTSVAIIGTVEMFMAAWLSAVLLKSERKPGLIFAIASVLALIGTIVIALG